MEHIQLHVVLLDVMRTETRDHSLLLHFEFYHFKLIWAELRLLKYFLISFPGNVLFIIILYLRNFGIRDLPHDQLFTCLLLDFIGMFLQGIQFFLLKNRETIVVADPCTTFVFISVGDGLFQLLFEILGTLSSCR